MCYDMFFQVSWEQASRPVENYRCGRCPRHKQACPCKIRVRACKGPAQAQKASSFLRIWKFLLRRCCQDRVRALALGFVLTVVGFRHETEPLCGTQNRVFSRCCCSCLRWSESGTKSYFCATGSGTKSCLGDHLQDASGKVVERAFQEQSTQNPGANRERPQNDEAVEL